MPGCQPGGIQTLPSPRSTHPWETRGGHVRQACHTVGDLAQALDYIRSLEASGQQHSSGIGTWAGERQDLEMVAAHLPAGWYDAAAAAVSSKPALTTVPTAAPTPTLPQQHLEIQLVHRLGWSQWHSGKHITLAGLTVKQATDLQLGPVRAARQAKVKAFVSEALQSRRERVTAGIGCVRRAQRKLWSLRWDNHHKEIMWRLPLDGLCTAQRMHNQSDDCICGSSMPGRSHHFWNCPVAAAVLNCISANLPAAWCSRPATRPASHPAILRRHLWLMQPPPGPRRLHPGVWQIVCLAALNAMDVGRTAANKFCMEQRHAATPPSQPPADPRQQTITAMLQPAAPTPAQLHHSQLVQQHRQQQLQQAAAQKLAEAKQQAVARFWWLLSDFTIMNAAPTTWISHVADDHPFLCREPLINNIVLAPQAG